MFSIVGLRTKVFLNHKIYNYNLTNLTQKAKSHIFVIKLLLLRRWLPCVLVIYVCNYRCIHFKFQQLNDTYVINKIRVFPQYANFSLHFFLYISNNTVFMTISHKTTTNTSTLINRSFSLFPSKTAMEQLISYSEIVLRNPHSGSSYVRKAPICYGHEIILFQYHD